jgi:alpha-ketoglutaric semialdehyde dehydrogenase
MLTGKNYIGLNLSGTGNTTFQSINPATGESLPTVFFEATQDEVDQACVLAERAFPIFQSTSIRERANFLVAIAEEIDVSLELEEMYCLESGLDTTRFRVERLRTTNQLRSFSAHIQKGYWLEASIDTSQSNNGIQQDLRRCMEGVGPVVVFGASNFPLAYSTAGGDTASAFAAGCPVIVKSHPMHPGTGELVVQAIIRAAKRTNMPEGVFSNLNSLSFTTGQKLVQHPSVKAVGFTGSYSGGKALFDLSTRRDEPIPFFAEMGSLNPVFLSQKSQTLRSEELSKKLAISITNDAGQFCTKPGLIFIEACMNSEEFINSLGEHIIAMANTTMLGAGILNNFQRTSSDLVKLGAEAFVRESTGKGQGTNTLLVVNGNDFLSNPQMHEEVFGPFSIVILCSEIGMIHKCVRSLKGQLTGTIHCEKEEIEKYKSLFELVRQKSGRMIYNGVPTGVRVCGSMTHGGPFPASTDPRFTAVGVDAMRRFLRPVSFQNFPDILLPDCLKDKNILWVPRRINGEMNNYLDVQKNGE